MEKTLKFWKMLENKKKSSELNKFLEEIKEELLIIIKSFGGKSILDLLELLWEQIT